MPETRQTDHPSLKIRGRLVAVGESNAAIGDSECAVVVEYPTAENGPRFREDAHEDGDGDGEEYEDITTLVVPCSVEDAKAFARVLYDEVVITVSTVSPASSA